MHRYIWIFAMAGAAAAAQTGADTSATANAATHAVLVKPVDARKAHPGDQVMAKTTAASQSQGGVTIPKGARLLGHVTEASARQKGKAESRLGMEFDRAVWKGGEAPVHMVVQSVTAVQTAAALDNSMGDAPMMPAGGAAPVPAAAGRRGGLLGGAVGGTVGAVAGTATGAAGATVNSTLGAAGAVRGLPGIALAPAASGAGSGGVLISNSHNVRLDAGTQLTLEAK